MDLFLNLKAQAQFSKGEIPILARCQIGSDICVDLLVMTPRTNYPQQLARTLLKPLRRFCHASQSPDIAWLCPSKCRVLVRGLEAIGNEDSITGCLPTLGQAFDIQKNWRKLPIAPPAASSWIERLKNTDVPLAAPLCISLQFEKADNCPPLSSCLKALSKYAFHLVKLHSMQWSSKAFTQIQRIRKEHLVAYEEAFQRGNVSDYRKPSLVGFWDSVVLPNLCGRAEETPSVYPVVPLKERSRAMCIAARVLAHITSFNQTEEGPRGGTPAPSHRSAGNCATALSSDSTAPSVAPSLSARSSKLLVRLRVFGPPLQQMLVTLPAFGSGSTEHCPTTVKDVLLETMPRALYAALLSPSTSATIIAEGIQVPLSCPLAWLALNVYLGCVVVALSGSS